MVQFTNHSILSEAQPGNLTVQLDKIIVMQCYWRVVSYSKIKVANCLRQKSAYSGICLFA